MKLSFLFLFIPFVLALTPGDPLPQISAKNQSGKVVQFSHFKGQYLLIYFYPKDETSGCTKEAETLRDRYADIKALGADVVGVSRQDEKSHQEFISNHKLPFDLLVDEDGSIAKTLGVDTVPLLGFTKRKSLLFGPDGKLLRFYSDVDPAKHAGEVIADIKKFKNR